MADLNMFSGLKTPRDITNYTLFRGTTDFTQLAQFDMYESGYPYLILVSIPEFLLIMAKKNSNIEALVKNYMHIIEYEFKGFGSGLPDIAAETTPISNGMQDMNVITKVTGDTATTFSMNYTEKSGTPITKLHELYLRSVRDPGTGFKTYNGLISVDGADGGVKAADAGFHNECFSFLYLHTDNTGLLVERAAYLVGCMPTSSQISIFNGTKGDIQFQEISVEFTGFPIQGKLINERAEKILTWMNSEANELHTRRNSWNYEYNAVADSKGELNQEHLTSASNII